MSIVGRGVGRGSQGSLTALGYSRGGGGSFLGFAVMYVFAPLTSIWSRLYDGGIGAYVTTMTYTEDVLAGIYSTVRASTIVSSIFKGRDTAAPEASVTTRPPQDEAPT